MKVKWLIYQIVHKIYFICTMENFNSLYYNFRDWRVGQVVKAEVCKTSMHRFNSGTLLIRRSGEIGRHKGLKIPR